VLILIGVFGITAPVFATIPSNINFGDVAVDTTSKKTITIRNRHRYDLIFRRATVRGVRFKVSGPSWPLTLKAGRSKSFRISFAPVKTGRVTGRLQLITNRTVLTGRRKIWFGDDSLIHFDFGSH
jgi:hypothetical protein